MLDELKIASRRVMAARSSLTALGLSFPRAPQSRQTAVSLVEECCNHFGDAVRYLNARRKVPSLAITSEAAVQDVLFLLLRPNIPDLAWENPNLKEAGRSWRPDFTSAAPSIAVDAKYVRDASHGRSIVRELDEDIAAAREAPCWQALFFFVYDPSLYLPDVKGLLLHCNGTHYHEGSSVCVRTIVFPSGT